MTIPSKRPLEGSQSAGASPFSKHPHFSNIRSKTKFNSPDLNLNFTLSNVKSFRPESEKSLPVFIQSKSNLMLNVEDVDEFDLDFQDLKQEFEMNKFNNVVNNRRRFSTTSGLSSHVSVCQELIDLQLRSYTNESFEDETNFSNDGCHNVSRPGNPLATLFQQQEYQNTLVSMV